MGDDFVRAILVCFCLRFGLLGFGDFFGVGCYLGVYYLILRFGWI